MTELSCPECGEQEIVALHTVIHREARTLEMWSVGAYENGEMWSVGAYENGEVEDEILDSEFETNRCNDCGYESDDNADFINESEAEDA